MKNFQIEVRKVENGYIIYHRTELGCMGKEWVAYSIHDLEEVVGRLALEHQESEE